SNSGGKRRKHNIQSKREDVFGFRSRNGAAAQLPPKRGGTGVARGGKEEGIAWRTQIFPEQMVSQRSSLSFDEETTRAQAQKPLVGGEEGGGKRERESWGEGQAIANTIDELRPVCDDCIVNE